MLGICFFVITAISVVTAICTGRLPALSGAVLDGAGQAVTLTLSLVGMMMLWGGVMRVLTEAGVIRVLCRILSPILRAAFPRAFRTGCAREEITAAVSANLLGVGNAATPLALAAMEKMQRENPTPDTATDDMVTLSVLATVSPSLLPATVIALRRAAGAARPFEILLPVWITSFTCAAAAVILCRLWAWAKGRRGGAT